jgi:hypothetical protein
LRRAEGGAKIVGVFRVINHDFTPKNHISNYMIIFSKTNAFVTMDLQKRAQEAALSELADNMSPTAIFNRFDLSASTAKQPALPFLISGLGYLASKLRKNLLPLFL